MEDEESRSRKARLRYHQPQPPLDPASYHQHHRYPQLPSLPPAVVQSASTSPHDVHMNVAPHALPHFHETMWTRPLGSTPARHAPVATTTLPPPPSYQQQQQFSKPRYEHHQSQQQTFSESPIPSAPFANAGPPGVHFYPTPVQRSTSVYPAHQYQHQQHHNWSRGR